VSGVTLLVGGLTVAPHIFYQVGEAGAELRDGDGGAARWAAVAGSIEGGVERLLDVVPEPGRYAESLAVADHEVTALHEALAAFGREAADREHATARLDQLRLPPEYRDAAEARRRADRARVLIQAPTAELIERVAAQVDTMRPILQHEREFDQFAARMRDVNSATLVAEAEEMQRAGQPLRSALTEALDRARGHGAAGRLPSGLVDYLQILVAGFEEFDGLVAGMQARDEPAVRRILAALRDRARQLEGHDPGRISAAYVRESITPLLRGWLDRVEEVRRQDEAAERLVRDRHLETMVRWSW